jgi:hypothetical protein
MPATALCAKCKSRVEDGAVRCPNCDAQLSPPGAFIQVVGWIVIVISLIPFSISEVTLGERDWRPLILGVAVALAGLVMVVLGRAKNKAAPAAVIEESTAASAPPQP